MIQLNQSRTTFKPNPHSYYSEDGVVLSGVTSMLSRQLFPKKYEGIKQEVLEAAKKIGDLVHADINLSDSFGVEPNTIQGEQYRELKGNYKTITNEYLVSNETTHATCIDCIWTDEEENIILLDIKTTSSLDEEYLSWQLSTCAYLFELQNPHLKVSRLVAIWLPNARYGKPMLKEVKRIDDKEIIMLMQCDAKGVQYTKPDSLIVVESENLPAQYQTLEALILKAKADKEEADKREASYKQQLLEAMMQHGVKKWETDRIVLTVKDAYVRESVDAQKLKEKYESVYNDVRKETKIKESLTIKIK